MSKAEKGGYPDRGDEMGRTIVGVQVQAGDICWCVEKGAGREGDVQSNKLKRESKRR